MQSIVKQFQRAVTLLAVLLLCVSCRNSYLPSMSYNPWQQVALPTSVTLQDIGFTEDLMHGWLVGSDATILETKDGGETWEPKTLDLDGEKVRLTSVSFSGDEGWMVGIPSILLHSTDAGSSWSRIPLSYKLPGNTESILALGPESAEMTTDVGAIYRTTDAGKTWKAMVKEAVGVLRNISRAADGKYVTVSANGNFYSTWSPGEDAWEPHNRNSSRRVQNMGFGKDGRLWMLARGGQIQFTKPDNFEEWEPAIYPERWTSWGLLDLAYRTPTEIWVAGGSGNLLCSFDGGETWQKDSEVQDIPANLYKIIFLTPEFGFIIGNNGVLLKYQQPSQAA